MPGHLSTYAYRAQLANRTHPVLQRRVEDASNQLPNIGAEQVTGSQFSGGTSSSNWYATKFRVNQTQQQT